MLAKVKEMVPLTIECLEIPKEKEIAKFFLRYRVGIKRVDFGVFILFVEFKHLNIY